jgi:hypothetical protein
MALMARHAAGATRSRRPMVIVAGVVVAAVIALVVGLNSASHSKAAPGHPLGGGHRISTTTSSEPATTTTTTLPVPAAGFVAGRVTAVGDSVMLDYQTPLESDIPGVDIEAAVSRQWGAGEELLAELKSEGQLGAEVIVALGSNGPITEADFNTMMATLQGASRIVFVNVHVDRPWQDPNNAVLAQGAAQYSRVVIADWATLADANPQWFGGDGTHLAINGPGAVTLASLITTTLSQW